MLAHDLPKNKQVPINTIQNMHLKKRFSIRQNFFLFNNFAEPCLKVFLIQKGYTIFNSNLFRNIYHVDICSCSTRSIFQISDINLTKLLNVQTEFY